jgi:dTDP-4-amino-4,6-dideoxygalactose transaminase
MMTTSKHEPILLSPPHLGDAEQALVEEAFETNWIAPVGPHVDAFEVELATCVDVPHACALSSGTAAIHLGLLLLGVRPGDIVLCSAMTFVASANPIRYCGAEPIFIDADPETWCMSVPALERTLDRLAAEGRTPRACIAVSLYGQAADLPAIAELCASHGVKLLDEAAEALGASHGDRMAGTFGDLGVYSFNGNKIITTSGGGALVGSDEALIEQARFLSTQARDDSAIGSYEHTVMGFNYRLSNVLAGIGRGQLQVLDERIEARRRIFERYRDGLSDITSIFWMPEAAYGRATRWLTCCLLEDPTKRDPLVIAMHEQAIDARPVWKPMHRQELFADARFFEHEPDRDVASDLSMRGMCLPSGSNLSTLEQDRVIDLVRTHFKP